MHVSIATNIAGSLSIVGSIHKIWIDLSLLVNNIRIENDPKRRFYFRFSSYLYTNLPLPPLGVSANDKSCAMADVSCNKWLSSQW